MTETVWLIDWEDPKKNHFAFAEEVSIKGHHTKRPDVVLYVNGIALGIRVQAIHVRRCRMDPPEHRQPGYGFHPSFFTTIQFLLAGNDREGLRYGVVDTMAKYWMNWKEESKIEAPLGPRAGADVQESPPA